MTRSIEQKKLYETKARAELDKLNAQIDELKAKAEQAKADIHLKYQDRLKSLRVKQAAAQTKLQELQAEEEGFWQEQTAAESAWEDLKTAFHRTMVKLGILEY